MTTGSPLASIIAAAAAGCALSFGVQQLYRIYLLRSSTGVAKEAASLEERSTTSSAGGGAAAYETRKAVDEYLQFHFGDDNDILPYANGPKARTSWHQA